MHDVIGVGGADDAAHGQPHAPGQEGAHRVSEGSCGDHVVDGCSEGHLSPAYQLQVGPHEVGRLRGDAHPVDGIDGADALLLDEVHVAEELLQHAGLLVGVALRAVHVHVGVLHGHHLQLLYRAHAALGIQAEDLDIGAASHTVNGGRSGVATGLHHNLGLLVLFTQHIVQQLTTHLLSNVLESEGGTERSIQQPDTRFTELCDWQGILTIVE